LVINQILEFVWNLGFVIWDLQTMFVYTLKTIFSNKLRSGLTALGIIIGVWAVILLVAIGNGLKFYISQQFEELGSNLIFVMPGNVLKNGQYNPKQEMSMLSGIKFDKKDWQELGKINSAAGVVPIVLQSGSCSHGREKTYVEIIGTTAQMEKVRSLTPKAGRGRFFSQAEERRGKRVVVLGYQVAEDLFGPVSPVGKKIKIEDRRFTVIGVAPKKGGSGNMGVSLDQRVYIPYKASWLMTNEEKFNFILVKAKKEQLIPEIKERIKTLLLKQYDEDEFSVVDQTEILGVINNILGVLTLALAGIAAISLIVGGVGIMNTMYATVAERTREVGLRKAIGATNKAIRNQFLLESIILSLAGGTIGLLLSVITTVLVNRFFPAKITPWSVFLALGVSSFVGITFGLAPARRASRLSPVEALHYE